MSRYRLFITALLTAGSAAVLCVMLLDLRRAPLSDLTRGTRVNMPTDANPLGSDPMPYRRLPSPRNVVERHLPDDLRKFFALNEGVGLESDPERTVRLCKLSEVKAIKWADLHILGKDEPDQGWNEFAGYRVGVSSFFDEIVYVIKAPACAPGTVLTLGPDVSGPGGTGPAAIEPSLVLASNFAEWMRNMERNGWREFGLTPGDIRGLPVSQKDQILRYYKGLNPGIKWEDR
jgi:hypothetical protein